MTTQFVQKMNITEAGFHLLMSLSMADGNLDASETNVLLNFLEKNFDGHLDLIKEQAFLRACPEEERYNHFLETAHQFFKISTPEERNRMIEFAMKVVMADKKMESHENTYINALYDAWGLE